MARFVVGDVVIVTFPFSDLTQTKRRLAFSNSFNWIFPKLFIGNFKMSG
jgi:hypothetical protein